MKKWISGLALALACALLTACASSRAAVTGARLESRIGWLHGRCLALTDDEALAGVELTVVDPGDGATTVTARIVGRTDDAKVCPALLDDRRTANLGNGLTFYEIDADGAPELGIGVVRDGNRPTPVEDLLDTDGDGRRDTFAHCTTAEGVRFSVWAGEAYRGRPLWEGYYYLGYDAQADCPTDE